MTEKITSLAALKRRLTPGTVLEVTQHKFPNLMGERTVLKAQTKSICLSVPAGHPREGKIDGSWLDYPPAGRLTFNDDGTIVIEREPGWNDDGPFMTFRIKES
jgi:hypothetical protein